MVPMNGKQYTLTSSSLVEVDRAFYMEKAGILYANSNAEDNDMERLTISEIFLSGWYKLKFRDRIGVAKPIPKRM